MLATEEIMDNMETSKVKEIHDEYSAYAKRCIHNHEKPLSPDEWLEINRYEDIAQVTAEIKARKEQEKQYAIEINQKFKAMMYENGYGTIIERARYFGLGKV